MLLCLYTGRYPICRLDRPQYYQPYDEFLEARKRLGILIHIDESDESDVCHDVTFHAGLLKVADKYEVPDLARKAAEHTLRGMQSLSQAVVSPGFTDHYNGCIVSAIEVSYTISSNCYQPLKDAAIFLARSYIKRGAQKAEHEQQFRNLLQEHGDFAWDMVSKNLMCPTAKYICDNCHSQSEKIQGLVQTSDCSCGMRELCGKCPNWDSVFCETCLSTGYCYSADTQLNGKI